MSGPIEVKVSAATIASAVSGLGLWALQTYVFRTDVPLPVVAAVTTVVPAVVTFIAGYLAPHTPRPDLRAAECDENIDVGFAIGDSADATPSGRHVLDDDPDDVPARNYMKQNEIARREERKI